MESGKCEVVLEMRNEIRQIRGQVLFCHMRRRSDGQVGWGEGGSLRAAQSPVHGPQNGAVR